MLAADGSFVGTTQVVSGFQFILDHPEYGVKVMNMSLGTTALFSGSCEDQIRIHLGRSRVALAGGHPLRLEREREVDDDDGASGLH